MRGGVSFKDWVKTRKERENESAENNKKAMPGSRPSRCVSR